MKLHFSLIDTVSILIAVTGMFFFGMSLGSQFNSEKLYRISRVIMWVMVVAEWIVCAVR